MWNRQPSVGPRTPYPRLARRSRSLSTQEGRNDLRDEQFREPTAPAEQTVVDPAAIPATDAPVGRPASASASDRSLESLFGDHDLSELKSRWNDVQAGFVDDPRQCVQQADGLVSDVVTELTAGFSQARSRLEEQWARGEEASTEDLRIALKRYRDFFDRLLAV